MRLLDALAFTSLWVAGAAAALAAAAARVMGVPLPVDAVALAFCGTLVVYDVDRLRDLDRDRTTAPLRTAFVSAHRRLVSVLCVLAGLASIGLAWRAGGRAIAMLLPVLGLGLLHRRLKRFALGKPLYVTAAWVAVVVGLPAVTAAEPRHVGWVVAIVFLTILANAIASNVRDGEAAIARLGSGTPIRLARALAAVAVVTTLFAPVPVRAFVVVPLATGVALSAFHPGERYGHIAVDGALWLGALGALPLL